MQRITKMRSFPYLQHCKYKDNKTVMDLIIQYKQTCSIKIKAIKL